jgi:threonine/homoserine/homoserine lactone efflux protein
MIPLDFLSVFFTASLLLALAPGPDNMFVLTQAAIRGWRTGLAITVGLCTGLLVHTAAVAFGVAAIFQASMEVNRPQPLAAGGRIESPGQTIHRLMISSSPI